MPRFVTALYDDARVADQAVETLTDVGFRVPDIQNIDEDRVADGFFDRLFLDENGRVEDEDEEVSVMGIAPEDVDGYREIIDSGGALVIVMCEEARTDEAVEIFNRFGARRVATPEAEQDEAAKKKRGAVEPGRAEEQNSKKWFHVVDIDDEDPREGAKSHAVHVHPASDIDHQSVEDMPGARSSMPLERFEREFRVHFQENFADNRYSFDDYRLAYRYGMTLAENPRLRRRNWAAIEDNARDGWTNNVGASWEPFAEAVRFGWRVVRRAYRRDQRR